MKKFILSLTMALGLAFAAVAGDTNSTPLFNANEVSVSVASGYTFNNNPYVLNFEGRASYFATKNFGLEAYVPFYAKNSVAVTNAGIDLLARVPLQITIPLINKPVAAAPYLGLGSSYAWTPKTFDYNGKAGVEFRLTKKWGVFAEDKYVFTDWANIKGGNNNILAGLKLTF